MCVYFAWKDQGNSSWPRVTFYCVGSHSKRRYCHTSISKEDYKLVKRIIFFLFPKINHVFLQTYRQCNSLKIQKIIHYQSYRCTQGPASCSNCNTCDCVQQFSGLVNVCLSRIPQRWNMGGEGDGRGSQRDQSCPLALSLWVSLGPFDHNPKTNTVKCVSLFWFARCECGHACEHAVK